jgi:hypothetical protein
MAEVRKLVAVPKIPTINLAIGPMCPVRCEGCYTHFGNTSRLGGLITAHEVVAFARLAQAEGVSQATLSGGDPLFHPEIVAIIRGLKEVGLTVKIDTVGTALLAPARVVFKGHGQVKKIEIDEISRDMAPSSSRMACQPMPCTRAMTARCAPWPGSATVRGSSRVPVVAASSLWCGFQTDGSRWASWLRR